MWDYYPPTFLLRGDDDAEEHDDDDGSHVHVEGLPEDELGSLRTVLQKTTPTPAGADHFMTVAEAAQLFQRPDRHNDRDTGPFHYFLGLSADPEYRPILLVEPTATDWWLIDGIHRAAAFFAARSTAGMYELRLLVFVLPRPLR